MHIPFCKISNALHAGGLRGYKGSRRLKLRAIDKLAREDIVEKRGLRWFEKIWRWLRKDREPWSSANPI